MMVELPSQHHIDWIMCPFCTVLHDGALNIEGQELPQDGDANVCGKCARVSIYDSTARHGLRLPTPAEFDELHSNPDIQKAIAVVRTARHIIHRIKRESN